MFEDNNEEDEIVDKVFAKTNAFLPSNPFGFVDDELDGATSVHHHNEDNSAKIKKNPKK